MIRALLTLAVLLQISSEGNDYVGKVPMRSATTNEVSLYAYIPEVILPLRTDTLVLELRAVHSDALAVMRGIQKSLFFVDLIDRNGTPVQRTHEGEYKVGVTPTDPTGTLRTRDERATRMVPFMSKGHYVERFNLGELYRLEEGETYILRVHSEVKQKVGVPFVTLNLEDITLKVDKVRP